jgi:hypothetical protein
MSAVPLPVMAVQRIGSPDACASESTMAGRLFPAVRLLPMKRTLSESGAAAGEAGSSSPQAARPQQRRSARTRPGTFRLMADGTPWGVGEDSGSTGAGRGRGGTGRV